MRFSFVLVPYIIYMERVRRFELRSSAWKAAALPLCYTRVTSMQRHEVVEGAGFEPAYLADQIYSLAVLTTHPSLHGTSRAARR